MKKNSKNKKRHSNAMSDVNKDNASENRKIKSKIIRYTKIQIVARSITPALTGAVGAAMFVGAIATPSITVVASLLGACITGASAYHDIKVKQ